MIYGILAIIALVVFYAIGIYNRLVSHRNLVEEGWSGIDVQLKRRYDLIPNLVETVKGYASHEKEVFEQVAALRSRSAETTDIAAKAQIEGQLSMALGRLFAVAEAYPELKANQNFLNLQQELSQIEEQIQLARRYYNGATRDFNILVQSFPSNLVANAFHFTTRAYFEVENAAERVVPTVSFGQ